MSASRLPSTTLFSTTLSVIGSVLLAAHVASGPDMILRWNAQPYPPTRMDVVVHFHGYSDRRAEMSIEIDKLPISGLDFTDPEGASPQAGRLAPTLMILPRGNYFGGRTGNGFNFPALAQPGVLDSLINEALIRYAEERQQLIPQRGRLILTAHSGGGAGLLAALSAGVDPDQIILFDSLYDEMPSALLDWLRRHLERDRQSLEYGGMDAPDQTMRVEGGALVVLYKACLRSADGSLSASGTKTGSEAVAAAIRSAIPETRAGDVLKSYYRVLRTTTAHADIAKRYGWLLLADITAELLDTEPFVVPEERPFCVGVPGP